MLSLWFSYNGSLILYGSADHIYGKIQMIILLFKLSLISIAFKLKAFEMTYVLISFV